MGEIDEFVKVPRPDGRADYLGMKVLDEPALKQSDRALLTLQLKNLARAPAAHANESVTVEVRGKETLVCCLHPFISQSFSPFGVAGKLLISLTNIDLNAFRREGGSKGSYANKYLISLPSSPLET